jgi:hypothetical protein
MHNRYSPWDEPGVMEALLALSALRHYSAAEIAVKLSKQFKVSISRGSVIGKMFRENIPLRGKKSRPTLSNPYAKRPTKAPAQAKAPKPIKVDPSEPKPLGDVPCGCRYLHGDALDRAFCGAETTEYGSSWCDYHSRRVWNHGPRVKFVPRRAA